MLDLPPQDSVDVKQTEIVVDSATTLGNAKNIIAWDAALTLQGTKGRLNPVLTGNVNHGNIKINQFVDFGYTGDAEGRKDISKMYAETHIDYNAPGLPVDLSSELENVFDFDDPKYEGIAVRMGVSKLFEIGDLIKLKAELYPISNVINENGEMEVLGILSGNMKVTDKLRIYGMTRAYKKGDDLTPLGMIGANYSFGNWNVNAVYKNWPLKNVNPQNGHMEVTRDNSIYIGFGRRFTGK